MCEPPNKKIFKLETTCDDLTWSISLNSDKCFPCLYYNYGFEQGFAYRSGYLVGNGFEHSLIVQQVNAVIKTIDGLGQLRPIIRNRKQIFKFIVKEFNLSESEKPILHILLNYPISHILNLRIDENDNIMKFLVKYNFRLYWY